MSHHKERSEKNCLNCCTEPLHDRYCHHCGQENVPPKQTLWHLVTHFFNDVTHFDGKFFSTMKLLLLKPGFLSREYVEGKRVKYLDPIRMYLFISAVFFIIAYSVTKVEGVRPGDYKAMQFIDTLRMEAALENDGMEFTLVSDPRFDKQVSLFGVPPALRHGGKYYDSLQNALPASQRTEPIDRYFNRRLAEIYQTYDANPYNFIPNSFNLFIHSASKIFFISMPIFAFFLYLLYVRRRKEWSYVSHAIFTLHFYCVSFFFLLLLLLPIQFDIGERTSLAVFTIVPAGLLIYLFIAMLQYYRQHWFKTILKFVLLTIFNFFTIFCLVVIMFLNALASAH